MKPAMIKYMAALLIMAGGFYSCGSIENPDAEHFYYYDGKKIYLQQRKDMILIKLSASTTYEQFLALVGSDASLQTMSGINWEDFPEGYILNPLILESRDGRDIPSSTIESFKKSPEVVSATYMYQYTDGVLHGITDEFVVKLKEKTSYEKLKKLAEDNNCTVGNEDEFVKNQYMLYVPKTSRLNAMQMANLFYKTGAFEFAEPNMFRFLHPLPPFTN